MSTRENQSLLVMEKGEPIPMKSNVSTKRKLVHLALSVAGAMFATAVVSAPARADSASGDTQANVSVTGAITLTALTQAFTLSGIPGATVEELAAVTMRVTTNNAAGYTVTVAPLSDAMTGATAGNADTIPTSDLNVRLTGGGAYTPLAFGTPLEVDRKTSRSASGGDPVSNDYQITIPFVSPDTYTATLEYVATTL
jgi:hypothetical protein